MTRIAAWPRLRRGLLLAVLMLMLATAPSTASGQAARDAFQAMSVARPAEPAAAPDIVFRTVEGRETRLGELRGKVVLLGFFTAT